MADPAYQHLGLIAAAVIAFGAALVIAKVRAGRHVSLSAHAVSSRTTLVIFIACLSVGAVLLELFNLRWLSPALALPLTFTAVMTVGLLCTLLTAWLPSRAGRVGRWHQLAAYGILFSLPVMTAYIAGSTVISPFGRAVATSVSIVLMGLLYVMLFSVHSRRHYLVYQSVYLSLFFIGLLSPVYL